MISQRYFNVISIREKFSGINFGFNFLDFYLDSLLEKAEIMKGNDVIEIFDYRKKKKIKIFTSYELFHSDLQNIYDKFLIKERFVKYDWFKSFENLVFLEFESNHSFALAVIHILTKSFLFLTSVSNVIIVGDLRHYLFDYFYSLTSNLSESKSYSNKIVNILISSNLFFFDKEKGHISFKDKNISLDFWMTSPQIVNFLSKNGFDIKYGCGYGLGSLPSEIDYYLSKLIITEGFELSNDLFSLKYKQNFKFLMDYEDLDISKVIPMEYPYDELFDSFFFKKLMLNEYCFHTIIMSCFDYYIFDPKISNILISKNDPRLSLGVSSVYNNIIEY